MEAKEILGKVKQLFAELTTPVAAAAPVVPAATAFTDYKLADGGTVQIDVTDVGGTVMIDGNPALPGDLVLEDGTMITVGDNGVITAYTPGMAAPNAAAADDTAAKFTAFESLTNEKFASYETKFAAYEQRFVDYEIKMTKANKVIEQLLQLSQLIVDAPAAVPDQKIGLVETKKEKNLDILFN